MIITFRSKAASEIIMLGEHALALLHLLNKDGQHPGVITAEQLPQALSRLKTAIAQHEAAPPAAAGDSLEDTENSEDSHPVEMPVGLKQRAYPLLDMMERALAKGVDIMWSSS